MTIRSSTAVPTAAGLAGIAGIHAYWGAGGRWPGTDDASLAEAVVGHGAEFPRGWAVWGVVALLGVASASVVLTATERGPRRLARLGTQATALALLARGAIGLPLSLAAGTGDRYHRLDVLVYSPLCLALGAGALATLRAGA